MKKRLVGLIVATLFLGSCGGSGIPPDVQVGLQTRVDQIRGAAARGFYGGAFAALANLRKEVKAAAAAGALSDVKAAEILAAAKKVSVELHRPTKFRDSGGDKKKKGPDRKRSPAGEDEEEGGED